MNMESMINRMCDEIKQNMNAFCENRDFKRLTPETSEEMSVAISGALCAGGVAGFRAFIEMYEHDESTYVHAGQLLRFKETHEKNFLTPFGKMTLPRRVYQADRGGKTYVPLDAAWGMENEFATVEVREAVLYSSGLVTPMETETILKKCALFHPASATIKRIVNKMGDWVEANAKTVREHMRSNAAIPEDTCVLVASLDGANVPLREAGVKRGRPGERPGKQENTSQRTCYKNAMVGSISFMGDAPEDDNSPARLASRYIARMPEDRAPTFKKAFEAELDHAESMLSDDITKVVVCDGARGLWTYIEDNEHFDGYEKILDYFHALEHLSALAEALFGKQSNDGSVWYNRYKEKLLHEDLAPQAILRSADYYLERNTLNKTARVDAERERTFFARNKHRMTYADFRRRNLPIGSGIVEAACKSIVKSRMCRSGMRWTRKGGQHILHLRAHIKSRQWDSFWDAYKQLKKAG